VRLAADILKCGKRKIWVDPERTKIVDEAATREQVRELIKDQTLVKKLDKYNSRGRARKYSAAMAKGRHTGPGKRRGTANARTNQRRLRMKKVRKMRTILKTMRSKGEITKEDFRRFYLQIKGNLFRDSVKMVDHISKKKLEEKRSRELEEQAQALRISMEKEE
jgi:large subunit ribosomal protein L19e